MGGKEGSSKGGPLRPNEETGRERDVSDRGKDEEGG